MLDNFWKLQKKKQDSKLLDFLSLSRYNISKLREEWFLPTELENENDLYHYVCPHDMSLYSHSIPQKGNPQTNPQNRSSIRLLLMNKYHKNNQTGVIISPDHGAGFSTWTTNKSICMDAELVECVLNKDEGKFDHIILTKYDNKPFYQFDDLEVVFIDSNVMFRINEYDGAESIEIFNPNSYLTS